MFLEAMPLEHHEDILIKMFFDEESYYDTLTDDMKAFADQWGVQAVQQMLGDAGTESGSLGGDEMMGWIGDNFTTDT